MSNAVATIPVNDIEKMATVMAKSNLFGMKTPEQAFALMLLCQGEGIHPAIAVRDFHIIQGRPALKADAMMARFQQAGGKVEWKTYTDSEVTGVFSHPQGGSVTITWTFAQASKIGLTGKDNWRNYPRAMLRARVISEGIRTVYPGCVVGTYTPEEVQDFEPARQIKDITPTTVADVLEAPSGDFTIVQPDGQVYAAYDTLDDWIQGYSELSGRIQASKKLSDEQKADKLVGLREANKARLDGLKAIHKAKLNATLVEAGVSVSPKPQESVVDDWEPSEQQS